MVAQLLMLFHVRSQGELAIPKADSSAFIERSRRLDRFYSIDADEAPFCADRLCCHGQQSTGMPRPPGLIRGSSESTQRPQVCHRERLRCIEYALLHLQMVRGERKEERRALWIEENRKVGGCVTQRIGVAGRVR